MKKQKVQAKINLETLAGGAFAEKLNEALMQVAENIQNPNTDATTKRQITVNIKFTPNRLPNMTARSAGRWISPTSRPPIRIRNQKKHRLQLLHRDRIQPANLWISKTGGNRRLLPLLN